MPNRDQSLHDISSNVLRTVISDSFDEPRMVGAFIVVAEVADGSGETSLLSWWDGGSGWMRLGMMEWMAERIKQRIEEDEDVDDE